jgi:acetyl-CoA acetyltransferase
VDENAVMDLLADIAIVGMAETPIGKLPGRSAIQLQAEAGVAALADAGVGRTDVDAVFSFSGYSQAMLMHAARVAEYLGISPEVTGQIDVGGPGTHHSAVMAAAAAIRAGMCSTALCTFGENGISVRKAGRGRAPGTLTGGEDFEAPYGLVSMISQYALLAQRHLHRYGTTTEQLGAVAVTSRYHASMNENAHKRDPLTLDDHRRSPMVSSPLRMLDCSLISDGGGAFVVTSRDRAKDRPHPAVGVLGWGMGTTHHVVSQAPDVSELGAVPAARRALDRAGVTIDDADVVYVHDACTVSVLIGIEALGLCGEGEGGAYAAEGRLQLGHPSPVNLHGGMLSHGHAGGVFHFLDALRQLRGEAGPRQVAGAEVAIVSGNGGPLSTYSTMILGRAS